MSAFRTPLQVAEQPAKGLKPAFKPTTASPGGSNSTPTADQNMMYAWSIGVTSVARAYPEQSAVPQEKETCPPEVYIG